MVSSAAERDEEGVQMEVRNPQPQSFGHSPMATGSRGSCRLGMQHRNTSRKWEFVQMISPSSPFHIDQRPHWSSSTGTQRDGQQQQSGRNAQLVQFPLRPPALSQEPGQRGTLSVQSAP